MSGERGLSEQAGLCCGSKHYQNLKGNTGIFPAPPVSTPGGRRVGEEGAQQSLEPAAPPLAPCSPELVSRRRGSQEVESCPVPGRQRAGRLGGTAPMTTETGGRTGEEPARECCWGGHTGALPAAPTGPCRARARPDVCRNGRALF